jgi:hypothetical protein
MNLRLTCRIIRRQLATAESGRVELMIVFDPLAAEAIERLPCGRSIYDCLDLYSQQPQFSDPRDKAALTAAELRLARAVDLVCTSSSALAQRFEALGIHPRVARGALARPQWAPPPPRRHDALSDGPAAIYVGALDAYKVDMEVFRRLLDVRSDLRLVIIGGLEYEDPQSLEEIEALAHHRRVSHIGPIQRDNLGGWLEAGDFGIVAMSDTEYSVNSFPLKYWDYQWAGLPVLAVGCIALEDGLGVVSCDDPASINQEMIDSVLGLRQGAGEYIENAANNAATERVRSMVCF